MAPSLSFFLSLILSLSNNSNHHRWSGGIYVDDLWVGLSFLRSTRGKKKDAIGGTLFYLFTLSKEAESSFLFLLPLFRLCQARSRKISGKSYFLWRDFYSVILFFVILLFRRVRELVVVGFPGPGDQGIPQLW